jgi:hypothetical protein
MITLYDYINMAKNDFDTYDTKYDASVTVCHIYKEDEEDEYDKFCNGIIKKVNVVEVVGGGLVVNWCELIERNMDLFRDFTEEHWYFQYEDDEDEFIYQWINEIHQYIAGNVDIDFYSVLNEFVDSLE